MKYRKKPIVVDAEKSLYEQVIHTLEGVMIAKKGDWIITEAKGNRFPCKPDPFELLYEKVEEGE